MSPKKRSQSALTFPLVSATLALAIGIYYATTIASKVPMSETNVLGASSTGSPVCWNGFDDNFNGPSLDTSHWLPELDTPEKTMTVGSGALTESLSGNPYTNPTAYPNSLRVTSVGSFAGDFVTSVDVVSVKQNAGEDGIGQLIARTPTQTNGIYIERHADGSIHTYVVDVAGNHLKENNSGAGTVASTESVNLKIERSGSDFKTYYKIEGSGSYVSFGDFTGVESGPVSVRLDLWWPDTTVQFANFQLGCPGGMATPTPSTTPARRATPKSLPTPPPPSPAINGAVGNVNFIVTPSTPPTLAAPTILDNFLTWLRSLLTGK